MSKPSPMTRDSVCEAWLQEVNDTFKTFSAVMQGEKAWSSFEELWTSSADKQATSDSAVTDAEISSADNSDEIIEQQQRKLLRRYRSNVIQKGRSLAKDIDHIRKRIRDVSEVWARQCDTFSGSLASSGFDSSEIERTSQLITKMIEENPTRAAHRADETLTVRMLIQRLEGEISKNSMAEESEPSTIMLFDLLKQKVAPLEASANATYRDISLARSSFKTLIRAIEAQAPKSLDGSKWKVLSRQRPRSRSRLNSIGQSGSSYTAASQHLHSLVMSNASTVKGSDLGKASLGGITIGIGNERVWTLALSAYLTIESARRTSIGRRPDRSTLMRLSRAVREYTTGVVRGHRLHEGFRLPSNSDEIVSFYETLNRLASSNAVANGEDNAETFLDPDHIKNLAKGSYLVDETDEARFGSFEELLDGMASQVPLLSYHTVQKMIEEKRPANDLTEKTGSMGSSDCIVESSNMST